MASCSGDSNDADLDLSNFIKPEYEFKESLLRCNLVPGETLNSVERFIPKLVNSLSETADSLDELYFLFPVIEDEVEYEKGASQTIGRSATPVVLEIDGDAVGKLMSDPDFEKGKGAAFSTDPIPPSAISKYETVDRGNFEYNWRDDYRVKRMLDTDYDGTMSKIKAWEQSQGL